MKRNDETQTAYAIRLVKEEGHKEAFAAVLKVVKRMAETDEGASGPGYAEACQDITDAIEQLTP